MRFATITACTAALSLASVNAWATICKPYVSRLGAIEQPLVPPAHRMHNPVKEALREGNVVIGVEVLGQDQATMKTLSLTTHFLWTHAGRVPTERERTPDQLEALVNAASGHNAIVIAQLDKWNTPNIKPLLGLGIHGLAAPGIQNADEARAFLKSTKFPPTGSMGIGPDDTTRMLADINGSVRFGNAQRLSIAVLNGSIRDLSAPNLKAILSASLTNEKGQPEGFDAVLPDRVTLTGEQLARVELIAAELNLPLVGDAYNRVEALAQVQRGYRMIRLGTDLGLLAAGGLVFNTSAPPDPTIDLVIPPPPLFQNTVGKAFADEKLAAGFYSMGHDPAQAKISVGPGTGMAFVWADGEHRPLSPLRVKALAAALEGKTSAIVVARLPHQFGASEADERANIRDYLAAGARGLVQPNVSTRDEARFFVNEVDRVANDLGLSRGAVVKSIMIETVAGVQNLDSILDAVESHKDTLWVHLGPFDLLHSMRALYGPKLSFESEEFKNAVATIEEKVRSRGIALGGLAANRAQAYDKFRLGYRVLTVGSDQEWLNAAVDRYLQSAPNDPSPIHRDRLIASMRSATDQPWEPIPNGFIKKIHDADMRFTLNIVRVEGPTSGDGFEGPFGHSHIQAQTTHVLEGSYIVKLKKADAPPHAEETEPGSGIVRALLMPGESIHIPAGAWHEFTRVSASALLLDVIIPGRPGPVPGVPQTPGNKP